MTYVIKALLKVQNLETVTLMSGKKKNDFASKLKSYIIKRLLRLNFQTLQMRLKDQINSKGTGVHFKLLEESGELSLKYARSEIQKFNAHKILPGSFLDNFVIALAQSAYYPILDCVRKVHLSESISSITRKTVLIEANRNLSSFLSDEFGQKILIKKKGVQIKDQVLHISVFLFGSLSLLLKINFLFRPIKKSEAPSLLTTNNEDFHASTIVRNKFAWYLNGSLIDTELFFTKNYRKRLSIKRNLILESKQSKQISQVKFFYPTIGGYKILKAYCRPIFLNILNYSYFKKSKLSFSEFFDFYFQLFRFIWIVENKFALISALNTAVYVYEDDYLEAHALNTIASLGQIKTIKLQYSNIGMKSIFMLSNPSIMFLFSNHYKEFFIQREFGLGPREFYQSGYPRIGDLKSIEASGRRMRQAFNLSEVQYVVGFFDENVQEGSELWDVKTIKDYLEEIHILCDFVSTHRDVGVIIKSQFIRRNPIRMYKDDPKVIKALETGRLICPEIGERRNLILPAEIAFASDICVGDLVGSTASLEAALAGTRSIMVDSLNFGREFREVYYEEQGLVFKNLEVALQGISEFRKGLLTDYKFGDWSSVLGKLKMTETLHNDFIDGFILENLGT